VTKEGDEVDSSNGRVNDEEGIESLHDQSSVDSCEFRLAVTKDNIKHDFTTPTERLVRCMME